MSATLEYLYDYMTKFGKYLFHFTDSRNIENIKYNGLCARDVLEGGKIPHIAGGDDQSILIDNRKGLNRYVHLCFWSEHPMEYRARLAGRIFKSVFIKVKPEILLKDGVLIADRVSTAHDAEIGDCREMVPKLDLAPIYNKMDWKKPEINARVQATRKYEVLVPGVIELAMIEGL